jgi:tRNA (cytidine56-2'-O)-methyltransferase
MYGEPVQEVVGKIKESFQNKLIIVGGSRVPSKVYREANWNVSVTTQPHSEVSALSIFLHLFFEGKELTNKFEGGKLEIIPSANGKRIINSDEK